jgi:hypothetical protein
MSFRTLGTASLPHAPSYRERIKANNFNGKFSPSEALALNK